MREFTLDSSYITYCFKSALKRIDVLQKERNRNINRYQYAHRRIVDLFRHLN